MENITNKKYLELILLIDDYETKLLEKGLLKLGLVRKPKFELDVFIQLLIDRWINKYETFNMEGVVTDGKRLHRSIDDIYRITKYYKPEVTLLDIIRVLVLKIQSKEVRTLFCKNIMKRTYFTKIEDYNRGYWTNGITFDFKIHNEETEGDDNFEEFNLINFAKLVKYETKQ